MIEITDITELLKNKGYKHVAIHHTMKNNIKLTGIALSKDDNPMCPCVYINSIIEESKTAEEAVEKIETILAENTTPSFDPKECIERDYILDNVKIGIQQASYEPIIKRASNFEDIDEYCYIPVFFSGSSSPDGRIRLDSTLLEEADVTEKEVWDAAYRNTFRRDEISIINVLDYINACRKREGLPIIVLEDDETMPMFIVTNRNHWYGASQALNSKYIKSWAKNTPWKTFVMIPASIHEVLLAPINDDMPKAQIDIFIQQVNEQFLNPIEKLSDKAYSIDIENMPEMEKRNENNMVEI